MCLRVSCKKKKMKIFFFGILKVTVERSRIRMSRIPIIVYRKLQSENSQDYAHKPQRDWTFMNSASACKCVPCKDLHSG